MDGRSSRAPAIRAWQGVCTRGMWGESGPVIFAEGYSLVCVYWKASWSMVKEYVEQRNGGYFIRDARVSLDSVVYAFLRGESPEGIAASFPALDLEHIFGALAFYMANREIVDRY